MQSQQHLADKRRHRNLCLPLLQERLLEKHTLWSSGLLCLVFNAEDGGSIFLRNSGMQPEYCTALRPIRSQSKLTPPWNFKSYLHAMFSVFFPESYSSDLFGNLNSHLTAKNAYAFFYTASRYRWRNSSVGTLFRNCVCIVNRTVCLIADVIRNGNPESNLMVFIVSTVFRTTLLGILNKFSLFIP
jgi:hypothetical protein